MRTTKPEPISVCIITKNCKRSLKYTLRSVKEFISTKVGDEIIVVDTGSTDGTPDLAARYGAHVIRRPDLNSKEMLTLTEKYLPDKLEQVKANPRMADGWIRNFAEARNICMAAARHDLIFWIDSDDVIKNPRHTRALAADFFSKPGHRCLFMLYEYAFDDDDGACTTELWRERILRKQYYTWKGCCHESLIPLSGEVEQVTRADPKDHAIIHKHGQIKSDDADVRNYIILRKAHDEAVERGEWVDPRWFFYLGNACRGLKIWPEARHWYAQLLKTSGSEEDRYAAALNNGMIYLLNGRPWRAIDWLQQALKIRPADPRAYFAISRSYYDLKQWESCLKWSQIGHNTPTPPTLSAVDPQGYSFAPLVFDALALKELGDIPTAIQVAQKAVAERPGFKPASELLAVLKQEFANKQFESSIHNVLKHASSTEDRARIIASLPKKLRTLFAELQLELTEPARAAGTKGVITYLCPPTVERWDGSSRADGIGGSEKMAIQLSEEWVRQGWDVHVYGHPKEGNENKRINGVLYRPFRAFNPKFKRDVVIIWRHHALLDRPLLARKIFVDLHDVQEPSAFASPLRTNLVDGYFFKSEFHAEPILRAHPHLKDKLIISRNGIDLSQFNVDVARDPNKFIFFSSADRGLLGLTRIFARIRANNPKAHLHVFYGFTPLYRHFAAQRTYSHFWDEGCDRHMLDYEEDCYDAMERNKGITYHGRVSYEEMAKQLRSAGIWIYPTGFPEISCMAAMEAQLAGCFPLASNTGALTETVLWKEGLCNQPDDFVTQATRLLARGDDQPLRDRIRTEAEAAYDLKPLAAAWLTHFE